eukprot:s1516_g22.t1
MNRRPDMMSAKRQEGEIRPVHVRDLCRIPFACYEASSMGKTVRMMAEQVPRVSQGIAISVNAEYLSMLSCMEWKYDFEVFDHLPREHAYLRSTRALQHKDRMEKRLGDKLFWRVVRDCVCEPSYIVGWALCDARGEIVGDEDFWQETADESDEYSSLSSGATKASYNKMRGSTAKTFAEQFEQEDGLVRHAGIFSPIVEEHKPVGGGFAYVRRINLSPLHFVLGNGLLFIAFAGLWESPSFQQAVLSVLGSTATFVAMTGKIDTGARCWAGQSEPSASGYPLVNPATGGIAGLNVGVVEAGSATPQSVCVCSRSILSFYRSKFSKVFHKGRFGSNKHVSSEASIGVPDWMYDYDPDDADRRLDELEQMIVDDLQFNVAEQDVRWQDEMDELAWSRYFGLENRCTEVTEEE